MLLSKSVKSLQVAAHQCLMLTDVQSKLDLSFEIRQLWSNKQLILDKSFQADEECAAGIPKKPELVPFNQLPKRTVKNEVGHAALIHSFAHIEYNAINIAWDAVYRFNGMPEGYYEDWSRIAAEEAYHFQLLRDYLLTLGYDYGSFAAHGGLWEMVEQTRNDVMIRMALIPRVLEARGLDVTPDIIHRFRHHDFDEAANILEIIYRDEIGHVGIGSKWFKMICAQRGLDSQNTFAELINQYATDKIRQPFNFDARQQAGFSQNEMEYLTTL